MSKLNALIQNVMRSPVLWGTLATLIFFTPLHTGHWNNAFVLRYFASHPVEHVATFLFFVALSATAIKAIDLSEQFKIFRWPLLDAIPEGGQPIEHSRRLLNRLAGQPAAWQNSYLVQRLTAALQYVERKGAADSLDDELHHLSDIDISRMHGSYSLVRIIIWAIPILGLLGTVIGITAAVANLSPQLLESSITKVTAGLGVAFDHTALALGLSMALMFAQYLVERYESRLLSLVDERTAAELVGRFEQAATATDPQVSTVRRLAETMLRSTENLVERQAELWRATIDASQRQCAGLMSAAGQQLQSAMAGALAENLKEHAAILAAAEQSAAQQNRDHWAQVQAALLQNAEAVTLQERELAKQSEVLLRVVEASGHVATLEAALNQNLSTLAGSKNFEETVMSLSAAIHLLTARLRQDPSDALRVELHGKSRTGQAA